MGLPVPYSSLGVLQPTLLSVLAPYSEDGLTAALFFNSLQVMRYLVQYSCSVDITPSLSPRHHGPLLNTEDIGATRAAVLAADPVCLGGVSILGAGHASVFPRDRMERLFARLLRALSAHEELSTLVRDGDLGVGRNGEQYSDREKALREDYLVFLRDAQALGRFVYFFAVWMDWLNGSLHLNL